MVYEMQRKITMIRLRFDLTSKTYITFNRKVWNENQQNGEVELIQNNIWRVTLREEKRPKILNLIKVLHDCAYRTSVRLERDGYAILIER